MIVAMADRETDPLRRFFLRLTERTLVELGLFDGQIVDYLAGVLAQFARADRLDRVRGAGEGPIDALVATLAKCPAEDPLADPILQQRAMRRYVGDYALFMSGLFRAHVERHGSLDLYLRTGSVSYRRVSELDAALYRTGFLMFQELSEKFEYYSGALDYMRKAHFAPSPKEDPFAGFLKQVERWVRTGISAN